MIEVEVEVKVVCISFYASYILFPKTNTCTSWSWKSKRRVVYGVKINICFPSSVKFLDKNVTDVNSSEVHVITFEIVTFKFTVNTTRIKYSPVSSY